MPGEIVVAQQPGGSGNNKKGSRRKPPGDGFAIDSQRREYKLMEVVPKADGSLPLPITNHNDDDGDSDDEEIMKALEPAPGARLMVVKSKRGKTRPLGPSGAFSDRPVPKGLPPGAPRPPPSSPPPLDQPRKALPPGGGGSRRQQVATTSNKVHPESSSGDLGDGDDGDSSKKRGRPTPQMPFVYASEDTGVCCYSLFVVVPIHSSIRPSVHSLIRACVFLVFRL